MAGRLNESCPRLWDAALAVLYSASLLMPHLFQPYAARVSESALKIFADLEDKGVAIQLLAKT
jgi:hypothetical protein